MTHPRCGYATSAGDLKPTRDGGAAARRPANRLAAGIIGLLLLITAGTARGQLEFEGEPIRYGEGDSNDRVAKLQAQLAAGELDLAFDDRRGYLPALLTALEVPTSSQMLVFSQTSFQLRKISPRRPRALYFNDDTYVGWVQGGDVIEVSSVDPQQGPTFYTLDQQRAPQPAFIRDRGQCLTCHASSRTQGIPGHLVRSVYADAGGRPILGSGTFTTDHRSPFRERWGGWYVTGKHGQMRHMGNAILADRRGAHPFDWDQGANRTHLSGLCDTTPYLTPHSDLVALMVLEHQTQMHNFLALANFETRHALHYNKIMNEALGRAADYQTESTRRRIRSAAEKVVKYLLLADEFELTSPVQGVSGFATEFAARGPFDRQGRSLRALDLTDRLFRYPCSYLIYSDAFDELPTQVKQQVYRQLHAVLKSPDPLPDFPALSPQDRESIREILFETKPALRDAFQAFSPSSAIRES